ncbi:MAG: hypothetical protein JWM09_1227 [Francisellaceae bacterium]|nr:hypothetical protein [Francisellaceae bacterium]
MNNVLDYLVITITISSVIMGLAKGSIREFLSLMAWAIAAGIAIFFSDSLASTLIKKVPTETLRLLVSFVFLLVTTLCTADVINNFVARCFKFKINPLYDLTLSFILGVGKSCLNTDYDDDKFNAA